MQQVLGAVLAQAVMFVSGKPAVFIQVRISPATALHHTGAKATYQVSWPRVSGL